MLADINIRSSIAVYVQIENHVQFAIASGEMKEGERLPSVRELSERLEVNPNTVAKAYRDLEVMGYLYTRRGMGVFVNKGIQAKCRIDCRVRILSRLHEVITETKAAAIAPNEVKAAVDQCLAADSKLYGNTPSEILALAKGKSAQ